MTTATNAKKLSGSAASKKMLKRVQYWMEHHPIVSNSLLCLNLWIAGDCLAQYSEYKLFVDIPPTTTTTTTTDDDDDSLKIISAKAQSLSISQQQQHQKQHPSSFWDEYDWKRTAQCASFGAIVTGPLLAIWYPLLDRLVKTYKIAGTAATAAATTATTSSKNLWAPAIAKVVADEFVMEPPSLVVFFGYMNICEGGTMKTFQNKLETQFLPSWITSLTIWPVILLGTFRFLPVYAQAPVINVCCIAWDGFLSHRNALAKRNKLIQQEEEEDEGQKDRQQEQYDKLDEKEPTMATTLKVTEQLEKSDKIVSSSSPSSSSEEIQVVT